MKAATPLDDPQTRRCVVLSHPNHEMAVFGMFRRLRPHVIVLTDGGGAERVEQSRRGLERIGVLERTVFLDYAEDDFYGALLDGDVGFFHDVAGRIRDCVADVEPEQVFCDAIELYNPVHDLSLPLVRAALGDDRDTPVFEVPLVHQRAAARESYAVQRFPESRPGARVTFDLHDDELREKLWARDHVYHSLRAQIGALLGSLPDQHFATETVAPAVTRLPDVPPDQILRYDWRGQLLFGRGDVKRALTRADHYLPIARELFV
jgi:hypothetical protein